MTRDVTLSVVDQVGYLPGERKRFIVMGESRAFEILCADSGEAVLRGTTSPVTFDAASGTSAGKGDFSDLRQPGRYRLRMAGLEQEVEVVIGEDVYDGLHQALLKAFYYLRCGLELAAPFAAPWTHSACHLSRAEVYGSEETREVSGGWHDAGDYGRYTLAGAVSVADLLLAYEYNPEAFAQRIPLPESAEGTMPDVLHECRYELEFLLKMQETDGGAYHKVTTYHFCGLDVMPEEDTAPLVLSPISSTATGTLAAVMAMAARVYEPWDAEFAARCLSSAESAWAWMLRHPEGVLFHNPPEVTTGEYGDVSDADERYWAAAELFRTTGREDYHRIVRETVEQGEVDLCELGWARVGGYGTLAYLLTDRQLVDVGLRNRLREVWLKQAEAYQQIAERDGFGVAIEAQDYNWGSNMEIMNRAQLLLAAYREDHNRLYRQTALEQLHYLLGRNVMGQSYVTGFGTNPLRHPHYRPGVADGIEAAVPGMVSGGANPGLQDDYAREHLAGLPPAASFEDHELSYSTNEITIYWNSPVVFVTSFFAFAGE
jgi:endoglucanase